METALSSDGDQDGDAEIRQEFVPSEPVLEVIESPVSDVETESVSLGQSEDDSVEESPSVPEVAQQAPETEPQQLIGKLAHADQLIKSYRNPLNPETAAKLPHSVIHSDLNDTNLLCDGKNHGFA